MGWTAGGAGGGAAHVLAPPPQDGPQHAPAIQRKAGDEIEGGQRDVDPSQPERYGGNEVICPTRQHPDCPEHGAYQQAAHRSRQRHAELVAGLLGLTLYLRNAAENEQGYGPDPDALPHGHYAVGQLVRQDRAEKQKAGQNAGRDSRT